MKKLLLLAAVLLSGCASEPSNLILQPVNANLSTAAISTSSVAISSIDLRTATYLGRIRKEGEAAQLINAGSNPRQLLQNALTQSYAQLGYTLQSNANNKFVLELNKLRVDVDQETLEYNGTSIASATVKLENDKQELTKRFAVKGSFKGVMQVDAALMERELNDRIQQLVNAIVNDTEIHQFLAQGKS